jgi:threonyl-tRNA synthetase
MPPIESMRHSCAHVMAAAISRMWPEAKFGVGPAIDTGFYYDVLFPEPIKLEDLGKIEQTMRKIKHGKKRFIQRELPIEDALRLFSERGQIFKVELIKLLRERGSTAVAEETGDANVASGQTGLSTVGTYEVDGFIDLCRGPHVEFSNEIGSFRLHRLAGAYWRGNEHNPQLQRIYGLCSETEEQVNAELDRLEQIKLRDHRRIGKDLEIFHLSKEIGPGLPLWLPNGTAIRDELEHLAKYVERQAGYLRISTPHITEESLYYQSGHLPYYKDDMYAPIRIEEKNYYLRPMNCPHHHHIFLSHPKSYRDMPVKLSEYGQVYRYEASGALSGIIRTRGFCQNDAHIYCRFDQAKDEFKSVMAMHAAYYKIFDIHEFYMRLSLPDLSKLDKYIDQPKKWVSALAIIREAMGESGLPYVEAKGEAAFYGPKIDFIIKSAIGVEYAISTNQLDFLATERFNLTYTAEDGNDRPVYVIHRAPLGSHERFIAFLIEHYAGKFPIWLAPVQAVIVPISDKHKAYAEEVYNNFREMPVSNGSLGFRVTIDHSAERMQKKLRSAALRQIPLAIIVGENEEQSHTVTVRMRDGTNYGQIEFTAFLSVLKESVEKRDDTVLRTRLAEKTHKVGSVQNLSHI